MLRKVPLFPRLLVLFWQGVTQGRNNAQIYGLLRSVVNTATPCQKRIKSFRKGAWGTTLFQKGFHQQGLCLRTVSRQRGSLRDRQNEKRTPAKSKSTPLITTARLTFASKIIFSVRNNKYLSYLKFCRAVCFTPPNRLSWPKRRPACLFCRLWC